MRTRRLGWCGPDSWPWVDSLLLLGVLVLTAEEGLFQWLHADGPLRPSGTVVASFAALSLLFARRYPAVSAVLSVLTSSLFNRAFPRLFSVAHLASLGRTGPAVTAGAVIVLVSAARARELRAEQARSAERARIAREMGLGERVGALGGHLDAGPDGAGGFRLSARLPAPDRPRPPQPMTSHPMTSQPEPPGPQPPGPQPPHPHPSPPQPKDAA
ncbi:hypothetical protein ACIG5E_01230 [Kitasatospora sp. NPDC053057]|uniref:hypothetical protein n=1 Tax=Kitasatospora sp. NPDC053057 TaxID=3364062 RepID=UPI0037C93B91